MARDSLLREINSIETAREMGDACSPIASLLLEEHILRSLIIWWGLYRIKERGLDKAFSKGKLATAVRVLGSAWAGGAPWRWTIVTAATTLPSWTLSPQFRHRATEDAAHPSCVTWVSN